MSAHDDIHIESHMPKVWEQEETFNDILYDWMGRAPWLAISLGLHFVAYFILLAIPWHLFQKPPEKRSSRPRFPLRPRRRMNPRKSRKKRSKRSRDRAQDPRLRDF